MSEIIKKIKIPLLSDIVENLFNVINKDIHIGEVEYMGVIAKDITIKSKEKEKK